MGSPMVVESVRPRVLVADDEPQLLRVYARTLTAHGYDVATAEDGPQGLSMLQSDRFDVVVSDVCMPGFGGVELLRTVHTHDPDVPVVLMTAAPTVEIATAAIDYGVQRFLTKPFTSDQLVSAVARAMDARLAATERRRATEGVARARSEHDRLSQAFDAALDSLFLVLQPIVHTGDQKVFGYEALMRTREKSLPHPGAVLDAAERLGRLPALGRGVRRAAAALMGALPADAKLFVNLHPLDLADDEILSPDAPLSAHARRVVLEITERAALDAVPDGPARLAALRALGYQIAVDDLGAGYAALSSVATLEPEVVKIDMGLIRGIEAAPVKQKIVKLIVTLCSELGVAAVAEGVETPAERDTLVALGIKYFQGYLFAKPGPPLPEVAW